MVKNNRGQPSQRERKRLERQKKKDRLQELQKRVEEYDLNADEQISQFSDLPITDETLRGLKDSGFVNLTNIQKKAIPAALKGGDVMATAKTGSGKTLAFLVPTIESLIRNEVSEYDGLVALIVSPTRELSVQIFEVLTSIGKYNSFSAGLVTGGKDVKFEKERISRMNILVGTPGRLSQHFNESVGLETSNLKVLVLDEADRCLDMGFQKQVDNIIGHLPPTRQTLLYSATFSQSVRDLARLSLTDPMKIGLSSDDIISETPESLDQYYAIIPLHEKLDMLWSFIKSHLKSKILVFFSSLKQVQFTYETFRTLQPGIPLMKLYGRHKQTSRLETTYKFSKAQHACLFATDIVARGLDFPAIDWVIQVDCPEDAATYVHRVGRAARFGRQGRSLLMLLPSEEEGMLKRLDSSKIGIKKMNIKEKSKKTIRPQLQSLCFKDPQMKNLGQRAFISYFKSVHIQKDKEIFKVNELSAEKYAQSLGLPGAPNIKIKGEGSHKEKKNASRKLLALSKADEDGEIRGQKENKVKTKYDRMFERKNQTVLSDHYLKLTGDNAKDEEEEEDFMSIKRQDHDIKEAELPELLAPVSKRQYKKALSKKASLKSKGNPSKFKFDDEGNPHAIYELEDEEDFKKMGDAKSQIENFVKKETEVMNEADIQDKLTAKEKRQEKKLKRKEFERLMREREYGSADEDDEGGTVVYTAGGDADLDRDMEAFAASSEDERPKKKPRFTSKTEHSHRDDRFMEVEEPQTIEDLEALSSKLLEG